MDQEFPANKIDFKPVFTIYVVIAIFVLLALRKFQLLTSDPLVGALIFFVLAVLLGFVAVYVVKKTRKVLVSNAGYVRVSGLLVSHWSVPASAITAISEGYYVPGRAGRYKMGFLLKSKDSFFQIPFDVANSEQFVSRLRELNPAITQIPSKYDGRIFVGNDLVDEYDRQLYQGAGKKIFLWMLVGAVLLILAGFLYY